VARVREAAGRTLNRVVRDSGSCLDRIPRISTQSDGSKGMASQSPLKDPPLRLPGQSLDEEIEQWQNEGIINYFIAASSGADVPASSA